MNPGNLFFFWSPNHVLKRFKLIQELYNFVSKFLESSGGKSGLYCNLISNLYFSPVSLFTILIFIALRQRFKYARVGGGGDFSGKELKSAKAISSSHTGDGRNYKFVLNWLKLVLMVSISHFKK